MKYYLAPMEGITGYIFRNAYQACFDEIDKYYMPFIVPNQNKRFTSKELNDMLREHNEGVNAVPQIMTNKSKDFVRIAKELKSMGYEELNLNLGCPSRTVVTKGKGAGFLAEPQLLDRFLGEIFEQSDIRISVKTRLGMDAPEEFYDLIKIYNKYPLKELVIHPRVQADFYKSKPNRELFCQALARTNHSVCYNGDIFTMEDYHQFCEEFPTVEKIMLGRGILRNPGLVPLIKHNLQPDKENLRNFHDLVYKGYQEVMFGEKNVLFKMKELWFYMINSFRGGEKYLKKIRKAERLDRYEETVNALFSEQELVTGEV